MLIVHVADLHLGKTIHERELLPDQAYMLDALVDLLERRRPAALLIAGDVYDRSIPSPEALTLFDSFLERALRADPGIAVAVIPGNHDSAVRLAFGAGLFERAGLHLRTRASDCSRPIHLERGDERLAIWALPFLTPGDFGQVRPGDDEATGPSMRSQSELFSEALRMIGDNFEPQSANVLLAHCFAAGGMASESERAFVGLAEQVDSAAFDGFDYAALGHLHRHQSAGAKGRYPGSPLAYSFNEGAVDHGFLAVEVRRGGFEAELVPMHPLRPMRRLEGPFASLAAPGAFPELRDAYVEARLTDRVPVLNPADALKVNFPFLLSVRQAAFDVLSGQDRVPEGRGAAGTDVMDDFRAFHTEMRGEAPDATMRQSFEDLLREADRETT